MKRPCCAIILGFACFRLASAQVVIESQQLPSVSAFPSYSDPANWSPAEVPNNTPTRHYNVTINSGVNVDVDATISNLDLAGHDLLNYDHAFAVVENTAATSPNVSVAAFGSAPAICDLGTLSAFSGGVLRGSYAVTSFSGTGPAILRFRGANVTALRSSAVYLRGSASQITDENGSDALAQLAEVDATSRLTLDGHNLVTATPLSVAGSLGVGAIASEPTILTAAGGLTNFDSVTRTLTGGSFSLGQYDSDGAGTGPNELRFAGADIANNGSAITLVNDTSRITDLAGFDGLRNFARNLAGASLTLENRALVVPGDFTNDGILTLVRASFSIIGTLTNLDAASRTLSGGSCELEGGRVPAEPTLRFAGADIVRNAAAVSLGGGAWIADEAGNDALRNFGENLGQGVFIVGLGQEFSGTTDFTNAGRMETLPTYEIYIGDPPPPAGVFRLAPGTTYTQTAGSTINGGTFSADEIRILGGSLSGRGTINGNVTIAQATVQPAGTIDGDLTLSGGSRLQFRIDEYSEINHWQVWGEAVVAGTLEVEIAFENYLASGTVLTLIESPLLTGSFSNAPGGTRLTSLDGSGSFLVIYDGTSVKLTDFHAIPAPLRLRNISGRGYLMPAGDDDVFGNSSLIGGFIITGREPKTVVIRGIGPSLAQRGVSTALSDPRLELHASGGHVEPTASNNDWQDTQQPEIEASGLAPANARESALKVTLSPGTYTAVMREATGLPGTGLVEVYDLSPGSNSKLGNISTRGFVEPDGVLIGGVIVGGDGLANAEVVVRAIGPHLWQDGIFNPIGDPTLELRDADGGLVAFNDDWISDFDHTFPDELDPSSPLESVIRASLPPGNYTAIVRGKDGIGGTALVEFYDLRR